MIAISGVPACNRTLLLVVVTGALALGLLTPALAQENAPGAEEATIALGDPCLPQDEPYELWFEGRCTYPDFVGRIQIELDRYYPACNHTGSQEAQLILGIVQSDSVWTTCEDEENEAAAALIIEDICKDAFAAEELYPWDQISGKMSSDPLFDKRYYDGGSDWNEQYETEVDNRVPFVPGHPAHVLEHDASRAEDVFEAIAQDRGIGWVGDYVDNFEDCQYRTAMCCWPSDRQANDNNGNCAKPYDTNCVDADPADNTDICYVDMSRDAANAIPGGFALYDGDNDDGEGAAHCHGIAWPMDPTEPEARYRGNNMFYVSMYDHLYQRGYARNVPGAPMCACLEKMPVVSRSDCTELDVTETWIFTYTPSSGTFTARLDPENGIDINFNACRGARRNNDLESYVHRLADEGRATQEELEGVRKIIVGNNQCNNARNAFVETMGFEVAPQ